MLSLIITLLLSMGQSSDKAIGIIDAGLDMHGNKKVMVIDKSNGPDAGRIIGIIDAGLD